MSIYKQLNNESWLKEKYTVECWSAKRISEFLSCKTPNSVRQALIKFKIPLRGRREAQIIGKEDGVIIDNDVLCGTLLGDGCLQKSNNQSDITAPYFCKKSSKEDYALHVASLLHKDGKNRIDFTNYLLKHENKSWEKKHECYCFRTNSSERLISFRENWYPKENNYVKIVPLNLILTPRMILYWFMDDGYSTWRKRSDDKEWKKRGWTQKKKQVICGFCSESFTKKENDFLCHQINQLGISAKVRPSSKGTKCRIFISQKDTNKFFDLIGPCPVDSLKYKWKRVDT